MSSLMQFDLLLLLPDIWNLLSLNYDFVLHSDGETRTLFTSTQTSTSL
jgi:hypothetical protein